MIKASTTTIPNRIPTRVGTELLSQMLQVPPSRLYPSIQMLHNGPEVPDKHLSVILSPGADDVSAPKQSASYGHRANVPLFLDHGTRHQPCNATT